jgi:hypothetical protein
MWKLGLRLHNSQKKNTQMEFSLKYVNSLPFTMSMVTGYLFMLREGKVDQESVLIHGQIGLLTQF